MPCGAASWALAARWGSSRGWPQQFVVVAVGALDASPSGTPAPRREPNVSPLFGSVGGVGAGFGPAQRGLGHSAVGGQQAPVDADGLVVVEQALTPDLVKDPGPLPLLKAAMRRAGVADAGDGKAFHCMPVRSTSRIASMTRRLGIRGRWQPSGWGGGGGSKGSIFSHSQSGMRQPSSRSMSPIRPPDEWLVGLLTSRFVAVQLTPMGIGPKVRQPLLRTGSQRSQAARRRSGAIPSWSSSISSRTWGGPAAGPERRPDQRSYAQLRIAVDRLPTPG